jgi:carbamoyltransferase
MRILGISAHYHDAAAALLVDGRIVAAAQEERFSRKKHDPSFPLEAARYCLREGGLRADDLDGIAYYEKPFRKFDRLLTEILTMAPRGRRRFFEAMPLWLRSRLWTRADIERRLDTRTEVFFLEHHESHAASAFGPSPFAEAAVLTLDGVGEWTSNALWHADGSVLRPVREILYPDSLGLLYSAFTAYCGFQVNDGEYKLMGLAPYGEPAFAPAILREVIDLREDGSYALNPVMFAFRHRDAMTTEAFHRLFGGPPRHPSEPIRRRHADLARSIQAVTEEIVLAQTRFARAEIGSRNLCLAGGVALNCVANGRLAKERVFDRLWIQPAAGDAGGAVGAAFALWFRRSRPERIATAPDRQQSSLLGPAFEERDFEAALASAGYSYTRYDADELVREVAAALADGQVVAWFQGRMEFGPRALGNRSILADPRLPDMQSRINRAIKFREGFRPFAPVVREAKMQFWFDMPDPSPYMLLTGSVRGANPSRPPGPTEVIGERGVRTDSPIPAVTHVDGSARVQSVPEGANPELEALLDAFEAQTGCPVLLNTSFNVKDEPIVCTPTDAVACFARTGINRLALGPFLTERKEGTRRVPWCPEPKACSTAPAVRPWLDLVAGATAFLLLRFLFAAPRTSWIALAAFGLLMALGVASPHARRQVGRMTTIAGRAAGRMLAVPVMGLMFYAVVTPAGFLLRLVGGADPARSPGSSLWRRPGVSDHDPRLPY